MKTSIPNVNAGELAKTKDLQAQIAYANGTYLFCCSYTNNIHVIYIAYFNHIIYACLYYFLLPLRYRAAVELYEEAIRLKRSYIKECPEVAKTLAAMGESLLELGEYERALKAYHKMHYDIIAIL